MLDQRRHAAADKQNEQPVQCDECTIQIGEGYEEATPFEFVDDSTPKQRLLVVCWRCWESLNRRRLKRQSLEASPDSGRL